MPEPTEMDRVVAARAILDTNRFEARDDLELAAFMEIFHPGDPRTEKMVLEKRIEIQERRRRGTR